MALQRCAATIACSDRPSLDGERWLRRCFLERIARAREGIADVLQSWTTHIHRSILDCAPAARGMNLECENRAALCPRRRYENVKQPMCFAPVVHRRRGFARGCGGNTPVCRGRGGPCAGEN